jgi:hypothetical protein
MRSFSAGTVIDTSLRKTDLWRAALAVALVATAGVLYADRDALSGGTPSSGPTASRCPSVQAVVERAGGRNAITFDAGLRGEDFRLMMPLLVHEITHEDERNGQDEEIFATALSVMAYADLLTRLPYADSKKIVESRTCLSAHFNILLLASINSGDTRRMNLLSSQEDGEIFPGGLVHAASLEQYLRAYVYAGVPDLPTPGNPAVNEVLSGALGRTVDVDFDDQGLVVLDEAMQAALDDVESLVLMSLLGLLPQDIADDAARVIRQRDADRLSPQITATPTSTGPG